VVTKYKTLQPHDARILRRTVDVSRVYSRVSFITLLQLYHKPLMTDKSEFIKHKSDTNNECTYLTETTRTYTNTTLYDVFDL